MFEQPKSEKHCTDMCEQPGSEKHCTDAELSQFINGELGEAEVERTTAHLSWCEHCRTRLDDLADLPTENSFCFRITGLEPFKLPGRERLEHFRVGYDEFDRQVLVKGVRPNNAYDADHRRLLRNEAQIMARLGGHPSVVPVYAMDGDEEGRLHFAMPRIQAKTLDEYCEDLKRSASSEESTRRDLVRIVVAVCQVIAFAHDEGVVHLDLKPTNILVGERGQIWVIDWETAWLFRQPYPWKGGVGTLWYMAPEQALKDPPAPTEQNDVYSLGATLYHTLTRRRPFRSQEVVGEQSDSWKKAFLKARATGGVKPDWSSETWKGIPQPLKSICKEAMAFRREDRYASAADLANELQKWLDWNPVNAHRESPAERVTRLVHKYPAVVAVSGVAAFLIALILTGGTVWLVQVHHRERQANEELAKVLPQLGLSWSETHPKGEAMEPYEKAARLLEELARDHPGTPRYRHELGWCYNNLALLHADVGDKPKAEKYHERAFEVRRRLTDEFPKSADYQRALAASLNLLSVHYRRAGEKGKPESYGRKAVTILDELVRGSQGDRKLRLDLAKAQNNLGFLLLEENRRGEALEYLRPADELLKQLVGEDPDDRESQADWGRVLRNLSRTFLSSGDSASALAAALAARDIHTELVQRYGRVLSYKFDLIDAYRLLGGSQKEPSATAQSFVQALQVLSELRPESLSDRELPAKVTRQLGNAAKGLAVKGKYAEAARYCGEGIAHSTSHDNKFRDFLSSLRVYCLVRSGDGQATAEAQALLSEKLRMPEALFNLACAFSRLKELAGEKPEAEPHAEAAVRLLEQAAALGWFAKPEMIHKLDKDPDLEAIRQWPAYVRWRAQLKPGVHRGVQQEPR